MIVSPSPDHQLVLDDVVVLLRGDVVEVFHANGSHDVFHVLHLAVDGRPKRDGDLAVRLGIRVRDVIVNGTEIRVPPDRQAEFDTLFAEARLRRSHLQGGMR